MKKIKASQVLIPTVYLMGITVIALCLVAVGRGIRNYSSYYEKDEVILKDVFEETEEKNDEILEQETLETINTTSIIKPYLSDDVKLSRSYYDENSDEKTQENSIIFYGNTYIPNMGTEYSSKNEFDVVSVIDGTVTSIKQDSTLGYIVEIKHDNELKTIYQYLSKVKVQEGTTIYKGDVIGPSGKSIVTGNDDYTLHFEVYHKNKTINPEMLYTMKVEDFK